jgi:hypothetical protein
MIAMARATDFERLGFAILPDILAAERVKLLARAIDDAGEG